MGFSTRVNPNPPVYKQAWASIFWLVKNGFEQAGPHFFFLFCVPFPFQTASATSPQLFLILIRPVPPMLKSNQFNPPQPLFFPLESLTLRLRFEHSEHWAAGTGRLALAPTSHSSVRLSRSPLPVASRPSRLAPTLDSHLWIWSITVIWAMEVRVWFQHFCFSDFQIFVYQSVPWFTHYSFFFLMGWF